MIVAAASGAYLFTWAFVERIGWLYVPGTVLFVAAYPIQLAAFRRERRRKAYPKQTDPQGAGEG